MTTDKHKEACKYFMEELKPEPQAQSVEADVKRLEEYSRRLLEENIKLSNELNLPKDPIERAKVLEIINADYEPQQPTAREMLEADGYVAWHPEHGVNEGIEVRDFGEHEFRNVEVFKHEKDAVKQNKYADDGWQIRPVKLLFLDEGKCKKE